MKVEAIETIGKIVKYKKYIVTAFVDNVYLIKDLEENEIGFYNKDHFTIIGE